MASKAQPTIDSPSISVPFFPLIQQSRRGSVGSLSSVSRADKEALNQALDEIHNTASQSETLTTFNEFTTPPPLSSGTESKGIAGELQGGLSGLYSRFKASVGAGRDITVVGSLSGDGGGKVTDDGSSTKSSSIATTALTPTAKLGFNSPKYTSPVSPTSTVGFESMTRVQSPLSGTSGSNGPSRIHGQVPNTSTSSFTSAFGDLKSDLPSPAPARSSFASLAQATTSTVASPALNQVNVSAISDKGLQNLEIEGHNQKKRKSSPSAGPTHVKDESIKVADKKNTNNERSNQPSAQSSNRSHSREQSFHHPSTVQPSYSFNDSNDNTRGTTGRFREPEPNTRKGLSLTENKSIDHRSSGGTVSDGSQENKAVLQSSSNVSRSVANHDGPALVNQYDGPALLSKSKRHLDYEQSQSGPHVPTIPLVAAQPPGLPEFSVSRTSSSDTAGASSLIFSLDVKSRQGDASESASMRTLDPVLSKSSVTIQATNNPQNMNVVQPQIKGRVLSKEYWMRDENARDCFYCGDSFSTFRRKHHCSKCYGLDSSNSIEANSETKGLVVRFLIPSAHL